MKKQNNGPLLNEDVVRDFLSIETLNRAGSSSQDGTKEKTRVQGHSSRSFFKTLQMNLSDMSRRNTSAKQVASTSDKRIQGKNYSYRQTSGTKSIVSNNGDKKSELLINLDKPKAKTLNKLLSDPGQNIKIQDSDVICRKSRKYHTYKQPTKTTELNDDNSTKFLRRSNSYVMAVDPLEVNSKKAALNINNTVVNKRRDSERSERSNSYVQTTITKFENNSKSEENIELRTKVKNGVKDNIDNLFKNYHRKAKVGVSRKEEIEKLSQEINEIIQNSIKSLNKSEQSNIVEENIVQEQDVIINDSENKTHEVEDITLIYHKEDEPDVEVASEREIESYSADKNTIIETCTLVADNRNTIADVEKLILEEIAKNEAISTDGVESDETQYVVYLQEDGVKETDCKNIFEYWKMMQFKESQKNEEIDERILKHLSDTNSTVSVKTYSLEISDVGEEIILKEDFKMPEENATEDFGDLSDEEILDLHSDLASEECSSLQIREEGRMEDFKDLNNDENLDLHSDFVSEECNNLQTPKDGNLNNEETLDLYSDSVSEETSSSQIPEELTIEDFKYDNLNNEDKTDLQSDSASEESSSLQLCTTLQVGEDIWEEEYDLNTKEFCVPKELDNEVKECFDSEETSCEPQVLLEDKILTLGLKNIALYSEENTIDDENPEENLKQVQQQLKVDEYSNKMETKLEDTSPNLSGEKRISFLHSNKTSICSESNDSTEFSPRFTKQYGGSFKGRAIVSEKKYKGGRNQRRDSEELSTEEMEHKILSSRLFNGSFKGRALVSDNFKAEEKAISSPVDILSRKGSINSNASDFDKSFNNLVRNSIYRKSIRRKSTAKTEEEIEDVATNLIKNDSMKSNDSSNTSRSGRTRLYNLFRLSRIKNKDSNNNKDETEPEELTLPPKSPSPEIEQLLDDAEPADGKIVEVYNYTPVLKEFYTRAWVQSVVQNIEEDGSVTMRPTSKKRFPVDTSDRTKEESKKILNSWTVFDECNNPAIRLSVYEEFGKDFKLVDPKEDVEIEDPEKILRRSIDEMKDNSQKACLIGELRATEENYVNKSLHRLVFDYMPEIDMLKQDVPPSLIGKSRIIFGNADILYQKHKYKFLPCLLRCQTIEDVGECFLKHESIFKLYPLYSKNKPKSENAMRVCGSYFRRRQDELKDRLDLSSYLLTPIQRMAKYCLIAKALIRECEKEKIPCDTLKKASVMLHRQMQMGNDMIALDSILEYNGNLREQGELLQRDLFLIMPPNKQSSFDGMVFLFQQSILITSISLQHGMEKFIFKDIIDVTDMGYTNNVVEPQNFKVWFRKHDQKQYTLKARNAEVHNKWVTEIFNLLWRQLEANKTKRNKELEENGIQVRTVPLQRPASIPNNHRTQYKPSMRNKSSSYNSFKKLKKKPDTTWYEKH